MLLRILMLLVLCVGSAQLLTGGWILAKAQLAQYLIADAWQQPGVRKPWPWADTWPVLRLQVPELAVDLFVLEGGQGNALAFGPTRMHSKLAPGAVVISGHRDTHFRFLQYLSPGDELLLTGKQGPPAAYRVSRTRIVDSTRQVLVAAPGELVLISCYPFAALSAGGPLRYLVYAESSPDIKNPENSDTSSTHFTLFL